MNLSPGTRLGVFEILGSLGSGGMGEVFVARDTRLDRRVAIKGLPRHLVGDPVARERLRREALAAAALDHPFVCKVFELIDDGAGAFIVMEFVDGVTLYERLATGPLPLAEGLRIAGEIADALEAAHARQLVHRDLKPANVMLTQQGRTKVMDFGLARQTHAAVETMPAGRAQVPLTEAGMRVGTPDYMSPEQALGEEIDPRSDLFSFGILMSELLTGTHPFRRDTPGSTLSSIVREEPMLSAASSLPPAVQLIVRRLLAKSPGDRYQTISAVRRDLAALPSISGIAPAVQSVGRGNTRYPLVGRDNERAELLRGLEAASSGRGSLAMISGEPGIGKTRLTVDVLAEARRRGFFCLVGHCYEMEGAPPYVPFVEMLEYSARYVPPAAFRQALGEAGSAVSKLMPELRRIFPDIAEPPELPPEQQRRYLFNAYLEFVERSCRTTPIAVVLEDLHWADEPTLMLLQHVVQGSASLPLFIMATYRDVELGVTRPFARTLETLLRERRATRLALRRLPVDAVQTMLAAMSGHTPPPSLARVVFDETEGNPFFVEEVFQHLSEEGRLFDDRGQWRRDLQVRSLVVPESVRLVIGRRLERLGDAARATLATAAIVGRTFSLRLLESLDANPDAVLDAIEEAERAQLVVAEPQGREARYRFAHELIRQTLAEGLSLPRRQRQHARIADAIERIHGSALDKHASALAHHLYQAGAATDPEKTTKYLRLAAAQARAAAGFEEALGHLDNALSLWEGEHQAPLVAALLAERAAVLRSLGQGSQALADYRRSVGIHEALADPVAAATVALELIWTQMWAADPTGSLQVAKHHLSRVTERNSGLRCRLLLCKAVALGGTGRVREALDAHAEASRLGESETDPQLMLEKLMLQTHTEWAAMRLDRCRELAVEVARLAEAGGSDYYWAEVKWMEPGAFAHLGQVGPAVRLFNEIIPRAERVGHYNVVWICQSFLAHMRCDAGDLDGARALATASRAFGERYAVAWRFFDDHTLGIIAHYRGETATAARHFGRAVDEQPTTYWAPLSETFLAFHRSWNGDPADLDRVLERGIPWPAPGDVAAAGLWFSLPALVRAMACLGRTDDLVALVPATQALYATGLKGYFWSTVGTAAIAATAARDWAAAEALHREAVQHADDMPFVFAQPDTREWYARMLTSRAAPGDADRARDLLGQAVSQYEAMGAVAAAERTAKLRGDLR